jgi:hypothetical protein
VRTVVFAYEKELQTREATVTDTRVLLIMKLISAQDLRPENRTLSSNKRYQIYGIKIKGKFSYFINIPEIGYSSI